MSGYSGNNLPSITDSGVAVNINPTTAINFFSSTAGAVGIRNTGSAATSGLYIGPNAEVVINYAVGGQPIARFLDISGTISAWLQFAGNKRVSADVTNATTTMSNISDLSVSLIAGQHYTGEWIIKCSDSTAADGIKFDLDGGTATMTAFAAGANVLTGGAATAGTTVSSAIATDLNWTLLTNETWIIVKMSMTVNAAGTFIPRFAQNAHTTGTATISRGTFLHLIDTP